MAVNHKRIKEILGETEARADTTLQSQALRRAKRRQPPRTLTPFEWEQWYADNGVPEEHLKMNYPITETAWQRLKRCLGLAGTGDELGKP